METIPMEGIEQSPRWEKNKAMKLSELINRVEGENIGSGSDRSTITSEHSRHDSDNDSVQSPPPSPPHKRPCRRLSDFNTPEELELLKSVADEVIELKDYAKWFNSLGAEVNKDDILSIMYYCQWFSTLGTGAKVDGVLDPHHYCEWYASKFSEPREFVDWPSLTERYAKLALAYLKGINECDDYEYVRDVAIMDCPGSFHLNFYARSRVSESTSEPEPEKLFFAEVDTENNVVECCVLESEDFEYEYLLHPPNIDCVFCSDVCYSHVCSE